MKYPDSNILYNIEFILKDLENYEFPFKFTSIQFLEILHTDNDKENSHLKFIKNIINCINIGEKNIPFKHSNIGKLISKNFSLNNSKIILGNFKGVIQENKKNYENFDNFINFFYKLQPYKQNCTNSMNGISEFSSVIFNSNRKNTFMSKTNK